MARTIGTHDAKAGSSRTKRSRQHEIVERVLLPRVHHEFLEWEGCIKDDILHKMGCDGEIDDMLRIKLCKAGSNEEIFTSVAWIRAFNISEPIYSELGLYHAEEPDEEGFDLYFQGGLRSEEHFNVEEYVAIPRDQRASMQDLYQRIGGMEIRQGAIERMAYRELTTHLDMLNHSMISIISSITTSTSNSSSQMRRMMSSVDMTRVDYVTACFGSRVF
ncbi:hypothetical protein Tco_1372711 [Tanacetum coccineum]